MDCSKTNSRMHWLKIFTRILVALLFQTTILYGAEQRLLRNIEIEPGDNPSTLLILLHGYTLDRDSLLLVKQALNQLPSLKGADVLRPDMPLSTFSMAPESQITAELIQAVDDAWHKRKSTGNPYKRLVLVGHSIGALFARKLYVAASGESTDAPFEQTLNLSLSTIKADPIKHEREWASKVDRIVLLAGMNRGWSISHHMSIPRAIMMKTGVTVGRVLEWIYGRPPIIFSIRRGSSFITQLRLQWLAMRRESADKNKVGNAITVQLLGTIDDLVSPDDNIDLISGRDFVYLEVPESGHKNVINMDQTNAGYRRREVLGQAFDDALLKQHLVTSESTISKHQGNINHVIFVIHGIRDEGYWTRRIASRVQMFGKHRGMDFAAETSTYGYFPMLSFLRPGARQEKVEWLMDRYTEAKSRYPKAKFYFVGHSNGTYLLAKALDDYPALRFEQVVFAGSVVHRNYEWQKFVPHRVKKVLNFVTTQDWVVAWFPKALQSVGIQDLGSAGHDGFEAARSKPSYVEEPSTYVVGGHGAAVKEAMWNSIAQFIVTGEFNMPDAVQKSPRQAGWVYYPGLFPPLVWIVIAAILAWILHRLSRLRIREWQKTVAIIAYLTIIWIVLTEV